MSDLRLDSGCVNINSKLVSFLYSLMRDHVTPGDIEKLVQEASEPEVYYTNGFLALYAEHLAKRLGDSPQKVKINKIELSSPRKRSRKKIPNVKKSP